VAVIATATNSVIDTIPVGAGPQGIAVSPDGSLVYVANSGAAGGSNKNTVSVIATATNTAIATIPTGNFPLGVAVTPDGSKVYVANGFDNTVSVIDSATYTMIATISVGHGPVAFGIFIQPEKPPPTFAGTPGKPNCYGASVSALAGQFGGLNAAAAALGFSSVGALQNAILAFCGG
jgi:YVTN family beta-propeller protein